MVRSKLPPSVLCLVCLLVYRYGNRPVLEFLKCLKQIFVERISAFTIFKSSNTSAVTCKPPAIDPRKSAPTCNLEPAAYTKLRSNDE